MRLDLSQQLRLQQQMKLAPRIIQAMEMLTPPVGRNVSELIRQIKAFQHVRKTGEATPSGWQPGRTTLTPGPDLVGKVWEVWKTDMAF